MSHIYNSQLDAFELYHRTHENRGDRSSALLSPNGNALPALGHAIAGSVGAAISNICTYPLDLIITRLQIQRQLRETLSEAHGDEYQYVQYAAREIYETEGGVSGFYTGLLQDTGKTIADSFLFFLAYNFLRQRRIAAMSEGGSKAAVVLPVLDELAIGFISGSLTKLLTTPISNVVTRKQAAALTDKFVDGGSTRPSTARIATDILKQKGMAGFWSGYSASLVLTLNPSLTFFLFETFKRLLLPRSQRDNPPPSATFLMAAIAKACASSVTYPFSVAKVRTQVGRKSVSSSDTLFSSILRIAQSDGPAALYSGLGLELIKSFLSHGTTMILKQYVHGFIIQAYYILGLIVVRLQSKGLKAGAQTEKLVERARGQRFEYYDLARARAVERVREAKAKAGGMIDETADLVGDYVDEEADELKNLYGTGLARWFDEK